MALNRLTVAEMVMLFKDWVTPGHSVRDALEQTASLAGFVPRIDEAYAALVAAQPVEFGQSMAELSEASQKKIKEWDSQ